MHKCMNTQVCGSIGADVYVGHLFSVLFFKFVFAFWLFLSVIFSLLSIA